MTWKIGDIAIGGKAVLASMTKITTLPFRLLCRELGTRLAFTEMVNCNAVSRGNKAAKRVFYTVPADAPLGIQLLGSRPDKFLQTAREINCPHAGTFLEVNFSCPDREVLAQGAGAALLCRPTRIKDIVSCLVNEQPLPVTAKICLQSTDVTKAVKTACLLEKSGVSAITVHARTIKQKNSGPPVLKALRAIKKVVAVPVIGNGGVKGSVRTFDKMLSDTSCDAVMIGKAAIYHPGLFGRLEGNQDWQRFPPETRFSWLRSYTEYAITYGVLNTAHLIQRAKDFLRPFIQLSEIDNLYNLADDTNSFLSLLESEIKSCGFLKR